MSARSWNREPPWRLWLRKEPPPEFLEAAGSAGLPRRIARQESAAAKRQVQLGMTPGECVRILP
jgi:hypothetical protein